MDEDAVVETPVEIPYAELEPETLRNIIADLITRDGTDYGAVERTPEQKAAALLRQLESGEAKLVFDAETETIGLMTRVDFERAMR
jgi:uncharacterized protein YheU (UPF0270 family)